MEAPIDQEMSARSFHFFRLALWGTFGLTLFSGIFLMVYYLPAFAQAFPSVERIQEEVPFGWMVRRLHAAGGNFLLILLLLYLLSVFYRGDYKWSSPVSWTAGVLAFLLAAAVNLCGFFLPLSQSGFWGTAALLADFSSFPAIGGWAVDFLRGGKELGGAALTRFYGLHIGFSLGIGLLLLWMERHEGRSAPRGIIFSATVAGLLLAVLTLAPGWFTDSLADPADPINNPVRILLPWYFLFAGETLKYLAGAFPFWSAAGTLAVALALFLLPYLDRNPHRALLLRPVAFSLGAALGVALLYFTGVGTANARYGERVVLADRPLSSAEIQGAQIFARKNCAYCHQVSGREGRREGPDMTLVSQRRRSAEWVQRFIFNARLYQPGTTMPRYDLPLKDLEALGAYLLSLDPGKVQFRSVARQDFLDHGWSEIDFQAAPKERDP